MIELDRPATCVACLLAQPASEFSVRRKGAARFLRRTCKRCCREQERARRIENGEEIRARDRARLADPVARAKHNRRCAARRKARPELSRLHFRARAAVDRAVASGLLVRPSACSRCASSDRKVQAHHDDHTKPLDVMWLCPVCHARRHVELGRTSRDHS